MAEFTYVMAEAQRMCKRISKGQGCADCPLMYGVCMFKPCQNVKIDLRKIEDRVLIWASMNPESVDQEYPSWSEWQRSTFPNALTEICPAEFGGTCPTYSEAIAGDDCSICRLSKIPAEIAKKLGIKPIEASKLKTILPSSAKWEGVE